MNDRTQWRVHAEDGGAGGDGGTGQAGGTTPQGQGAQGQGGAGDGGSGAAGGQHVPYDRFKAVNDELVSLRKWREEQEAASLSEKDKAERRAAQAEAKAAAAEARLVTLERHDLIRTAALAAGFVDASDAVALIDTSAVSDAKAAVNAVADLAKRKPHLIAGPGQPRALGAPDASTGGPTGAGRASSGQPQGHYDLDNPADVAAFKEGFGKELMGRLMRPKA